MQRVRGGREWSMTYDGTRGVPLELVKAIDYQEDAIVSKTLVKSAAGTVTLFAFDTGQELSEHTTPFDATVQVLDGTAAITIEGNTNRVNAGQMIIMPAKKPHAVRADKRFKMLLTMIKDAV
jgi:quercetin dioxygenase-like cupin family protein